MKTRAAIAVATALLITGCSTARPLHRSEAHIRAALLKKTPIGTSQQDVQIFIEKEGWKRDESFQVGGIDVYFGSYTVWNIVMPATCGVWGTWTFDSKGRLIDIFVTKETDSL
jgi:hypothetical protein